MLGRAFVALWFIDKMRFSFLIFLLTVGMQISGCSNATEEKSKLTPVLDCPNQILSWADGAAKTGTAKIAHIYWPSNDLSDDVIVVGLYANLDVHCHESCSVTEADESMYSFYRSTHYWALEKVFDEIIQCAGVETDIQKNGDDTIKQQTYKTTKASVTTTWRAKGCALSGGPSETEYSGCISILSEPR